MPDATSSIVSFKPLLGALDPYHSLNRISAPLGITPSGLCRSSPATAQNPHEKGAADPQSKDLNLCHSLGISNGLMTSLGDQQSKNAPSMAFQSPSSQALTQFL